MRELDSREVLVYRQEHECGMHEAKQAVLRSNALDAIREATSVEDLKPVLLLILASIPELQS
jgi:hypothetical protein